MGGHQYQRYAVAGVRTPARKVKITDAAVAVVGTKISHLKNTVIDAPENGTLGYMVFFL